MPNPDPASITQQVVVLLIVVCAGEVLGRLRWRGFSLGTSGVFFVALLMGHFQFEVPPAVGMLGLVVFVYCLGINAGPGFFAAFTRHGKTLALLGAVMIAAAALVAEAFAWVIGLPADLAAGLFAGSLTSTPALAAALEVLPPDSQLAVGFGLAYPIGAVGVVLFVQFVPRWFTKRLPESAGAAPLRSLEKHISRVVVEVTNPSVDQKSLDDLPLLSRCRCLVSRVLREDQLHTLPPGFTLQLGQQVLLVGAESDLPLAVDLLGRKSARSDYVMEVERHRRRVVATSPQVVGQALKQLKLPTKFGVIISRVTRHDVEFIPGPEDTLQFGDALTVVGEPHELDAFVEYAGHRERSFDETDLISLCVGLVLGTILGRLDFALDGSSFSLGMAGGPLVVGLLLGHFGRVGPIVGHFPRAARLLLTEIGLAAFLADAGMKAGEQLLPVLQQHGLVLVLGAVLITVCPLLVGFFLARFLGMELLQTLGGMCGAMTSTPGLGAITSSVDSEVPVTSYAAVYPMALILVSITAPLIISLLS